MSITIKNNTSKYLTKHHKNHWKISLPFITPEGTASDIEQILETKKDNPAFKLELNFIPESPIGIEEYHAHEKSVHELFKRIFERRYKITLFTVSSISHDAILNNREAEYDIFTSDDFIRWDRFLTDIIIIDASLFHSAHLTFVGPLIPKHVSLVMEESVFDDMYEEISGACFEFENLTKGTHAKEISAYSLKLPLGSIIHMTVKP